MTIVARPRRISLLPPLPKKLLPLPLNRNDLTRQLRLLPALAKVLEGLRLEIPLAVVVNDPSLRIREVRPGKDSAERNERAEEEEDEALLRRAAVPFLDSGDDEDGDDAAYLAGCRGDTVACGTVAGGENFRRYDEGQRVGAWQEVLENLFRATFK